MIKLDSKQWQCYPPAMKLPLFTAMLLGLIACIPANTAMAAAAPSPSPVCSPLFNGGPTCQQSDVVSLNKKVLSPKVAANKDVVLSDNDFVENVTQKDTQYTPSTPTAFRLYVTNKTNKELKDVAISDVFPQNFLTFVTGPGNFDVKTHTFSTKVTLKANETKKITIQVLTASSDEITKNNSPLCTINVATASVNNKTSQDNSMLCVDMPGRPEANTQTAMEPSFPTQNSTSPAPTNPPQTKGGLPVNIPITKEQVKKTPDTGPQALVLVGLLPAGILGHLLRKRS